MIRVVIADDQELVHASTPIRLLAS